MGQSSGLDLENVISHLSGRDASLRECMHLKVYQRRPLLIAVVSILQSQWHSVNGRRASGDLTSLPLLSTSEDFGMNTVLLSAN